MTPRPSSTWPGSAGSAILVPAGVWPEVVEEGAGRPASDEVAKAQREGWVRQVAPKNADLVALLMQTLGPGEAEVIALATEDRRLPALLDETDARHVAAVYGLKVTGVIGILIRAQAGGPDSPPQGGARPPPG